MFTRVVRRDLRGLQQGQELLERVKALLDF